MTEQGNHEGKEQSKRYEEERLFGWVREVICLLVDVFDTVRWVGV